MTIYPPKNIQKKPLVVNPTRSYIAFSAVLNSTQAIQPCQPHGTEFKGKLIYFTQYAIYKLYCQ